jgi:hypothetical protein
MPHQRQRARLPAMIGASGTGLHEIDKLLGKMTKEEGE